MPYELDADDLKNATLTLKVPRKECVCGGTCHKEVEMSLATLLNILTEQAALRVVAIHAMQNKEPASKL